MSKQEHKAYLKRKAQWDHIFSFDNPNTELKNLLLEYKDVLKDKTVDAIEKIIANTEAKIALLRQEI